MLLLLTLSTAHAEDGPDKVAPFAGLHAGPAFSLSALGPAIAPRLELGITLPPGGGLLRIFVSGHWLQPLALGTGNDERLAAGDYAYTLRQHELAFALGPTLRLPELGIPIVPEASVAPEIVMYQSRVDGNAGGEAFGETKEQYTRIGVYAALGFAIPIGPVELAVQGVFTTSSLGGVVTGDAPAAAIAPMLGIRIAP